jgi:hypothetical protein
VLALVTSLTPRAILLTAQPPLQFLTITYDAFLHGSTNFAHTQPRSFPAGLLTTIQSKISLMSTDPNPKKEAGRDIITAKNARQNQILVGARIRPQMTHCFHQKVEDSRQLCSRAEIASSYPAAAW